jgi:hypothetical protein
VAGDEYGAGEGIARERRAVDGGDGGLVGGVALALAWASYAAWGGAPQMKLNRGLNDRVA